MLLNTGGSGMVTQENWATTLCLLIFQTNSRGFCMSFMLFDLKASTFLPYQQTEATLMSMQHLMTSRYNTCNNWACSTVAIELYLYTQVPGFEPGLFHKVLFMLRNMPLWLLNEGMNFVLQHVTHLFVCKGCAIFVCYLLYVLY